MHLTAAASCPRFSGACGGPGCCWGLFRWIWHSWFGCGLSRHLGLAVLKFLFVVCSKVKPYSPGCTPRSGAKKRGTSLMARRGPDCDVWRPLRVGAHSPGSWGSGVRWAGAHSPGSWGSGIRWGGKRDSWSSKSTAGKRDNWSGKGVGGGDKGGSSWWSGGGSSWQGSDWSSGGGSGGGSYGTWSGGWSSYGSAPY